MSPLKTAFLVMSSLLASTTGLLAQTGGFNGPTPPAAGCAACGGLFFSLIAAILIINIALLVWVARDAKNRGMDSPILWLIFIMIAGPLGLLVYVFARTGGPLVQCASCGNKRLQALAKCPHCGNS